MIIDCISDLHGFHPKLDGLGDLLIISGDLTAKDTLSDHIWFRSWIEGIGYDKIIFIAGNHDRYLEGAKSIATPEESIQYLCDSEYEFNGLKIWGSPYTPAFMNWAFMLKNKEEAQAHWHQIPEDTDILITHGPPYGILDKNEDGEHCGCKELLKVVKRVRPKLHVFGHIHEGYGECIRDGIKFVNCSIVDENYRPVNPPIRVLYEM